MKPNACHMPQPARRSETEIKAYRDNARRQITGLDQVPEILPPGRAEGRILVAQAQVIWGAAGERVSGVGNRGRSGGAGRVSVARRAPHSCPFRPLARALNCNSEATMVLAIQAQDSANKREYGGRIVPGATSEAAQHAYDRKSGAKRYQIRAKIPRVPERFSYRSPIDDPASIAEDVQYGPVPVPDRLGNIVVAVANNAVPQTVIRTQHLGRSLLRDGRLGRAA